MGTPARGEKLKRQQEHLHLQVATPQGFGLGERGRGMEEGSEQIGVGGGTRVGTA